MKNLLAIIVLLVSTSMLFAQEEKTAAQLKQDGQNAYKAKKYDVAFTAFSAAIDLNKKNNTPDTALFYNAAYCAYKSKQYEPAAELFKTSVELGYKKERSFAGLTDSYKRMGDKSKYLTTLNTAYAKYPNSKRIKKYMADYKYQQGVLRYNNASGLIQKAETVRESDEAEFNKLKAEAEKEYQSALPMLEEAYQLNPKKKGVLEAMLNVNKGLDRKDKVEEIQLMIDSKKK